MLKYEKKSGIIPQSNNNREIGGGGGRANERLSDVVGNLVLQSTLLLCKVKMAGIIIHARNIHILPCSILGLLYVTCISVHYSYQNLIRVRHLFSKALLKAISLEILKTGTRAATIKYI